LRNRALDAVRPVEHSPGLGTSTAAVVRTVTYVTDIGDAELVARAHREAFGDVLPAATLVEVSALTDPREKVEIEAYAVEHHR
jgi:enamine deaminase RidA (YjgF/YER057c/UK114 family)